MVSGWGMTVSSLRRGLVHHGVRRVVDGASNVVFGLDNVAKEQQLRMVEGASLLEICIYDHKKLRCGESCTIKCASVWD
jgi:hypothetical protein